MSPYPRRKWPKGLTVWEALVIIAVIIVLAIVLYPVTSGHTEDGRNPTLSNLKQCGLAALMYANDYGDRLPRAVAWMDEVYPYTKKEPIFHDPTMPNPADYGFAFRDSASSVKENDLRSAANFVIQFQTVLTGRNAHSELWSMPMPGRNGHRDAVGFADGHVRAYGTPPGDSTRLQEMIAADASAGPVEKLELNLGNGP